MRSKNKPAMTVAERAHVDKVAAIGRCIVCQIPGPVEIHEFEQGYWTTSVGICFLCHRGPDGWHGTRKRWAQHRTDMLRAINDTLREVLA